MGVEAPRPPYVVSVLGESCRFGEVAACGDLGLLPRDKQDGQASGGGTTSIAVHTN